MLLLAELILIKQCVCSLSHKTDDCQENNIDIFCACLFFILKLTYTMVHGQIQGFKDFVG